MNKTNRDLASEMIIFVVEENRRVFSGRVVVHKVF